MGEKKIGAFSYLQVSTLRKVFGATFQLAHVGLHLAMDDLVCPHVPTLGKSLAAYCTFIGLLAGVAACVSLRRKRGSAACDQAKEKNKTEDASLTLRFPS